VLVSRFLEGGVGNGRADGVGIGIAVPNNVSGVSGGHSFVREGGKNMQRRNVLSTMIP
jgi:hypothetical protein